MVGGQVSTIVIAWFRYLSFWNSYVRMFLVITTANLANSVGVRCANTQPFSHTVSAVFRQIFMLYHTFPLNLMTNILVSHNLTTNLDMFSFIPIQILYCLHSHTCINLKTGDANDVIIAIYCDTYNVCNCLFPVISHSTFFSRVCLSFVERHDWDRLDLQFHHDRLWHQRCLWEIRWVCEWNSPWKTW